jgi:hypothetical protein
VVWRTSDVSHIVLSNPIREFRGNVTRPIVRKQTGLMHHGGLVQACGRQREF